MSFLTRFTSSARSASTRSFTRPISTSVARMSDKTNPLDANKGSIGKEFTKDGAVGGKAEQVGGPFSSDGSVGKQFTKDGAIGGTGQNVAEQTQGDRTSMFDKDGAVGKQFTAEGSIGGTAQAIGGPFAKDGAIGKNFNADGALGGTVQENLGGKGDKK